MPLSTLVAPPRPPELPVAVPPPEVGQPLVVKGPHLRNDAHLANWTDDFIRVMKDAWIKLGQLIASIEDRILALEKRIADTYTFGQKGTITIIDGEDNLLALPLRVVRDEEIVEIVMACETPSTSGSTTFQIQHGTGTGAGTWTTITTLSLGSGGRLAESVLPTPRKLKRNERLRVKATGASDDGADYVVQVRCR